ncbi:hypothetical protein IQE94_06600 [Synechocystis sp. PCC 7339]|uniref:hypothetical protein n=1 Tax=unclassified Synechocystis TaxID=2640012 RepID=UPI001BAF54E1|nr:MULTISPECIES: hypothetical protein [unclassified Synechocystis]QUS61732.1 hypothetical protein HTZ78_14385 [Synechocystis sp. PCC 7338]UAJ73930.1 hypothetical protein IQE94_06600 [Synechocystis sp. PCC 7339]
MGHQSKISLETSAVEKLCSNQVTPKRVAPPAQSQEGPLHNTFSIHRRSPRRCGLGFAT